jgi:glutamyl-tRNA synthetase
MAAQTPDSSPYRGRLAPSPTGLLHLGHASTFWTAQERALAEGGTLVFRNEDLYCARCRPEFVAAMFEDLRWFGLNWQEGPDCGGPFGPYTQSQRRPFYVNALEKLRARGCIYPCMCSRQDVLRALQAPHAGEDEPVYPGTCRPKIETSPQRSRSQDPEGRAPASPHIEVCRNSFPASPAPSPAPSSMQNWRFRVPDGEVVSFVDGHYGLRQFVAGKDFGDFVVWRHDDTAAYQLAVVVDDAAMGITEVVRGEDLLKSTARQLLLYRALELPPPAFYHCPLVKDAGGIRLAKRHDAPSLRSFRAQGRSPEELRQEVAISR